MDTARVNSGSALLELLVALTVAGFVLLAARLLVDNLADASERNLEIMATREESIHAEQHVRDLLGRIVSASVRHGSVTGDERSLRALTWCEVPAGWLEECVIALDFRRAHRDTDLVLTEPNGTIVVRYSDGPAQFRYLDQSGEWLTAWTSMVTTPLGILAILGHDTLILRIGERG